MSEAQPSPSAPSVEVIHLPKLLSDKDTAKLEGTFLSQAQLPTIIRGNVDAYCKETGDVLFKMRTGSLSNEILVSAYEALHKVGESPSDNRGSAAGPISDEEILRIVRTEGGSGFVRVDARRYKMVKKDGTVSSVVRARRTNGGIAGYFGRTARIPYCRLTSFTQKNFKKFVQSFPLLQEVDKQYAELMPASHALQRAAVLASSQEFVVPDTSFSTVTVNKNFRTALHYDAGDFKEGFGNLVVIRRGEYEGCHTGFPQYGAGVDARTGDVTFMDVHKLHGNTPMVVKTPNAVRLALVLYFREDIQKCGSAAEELAHAVNRRDI